MQERVKIFGAWCVAILGGGAILYFILRYALGVLLPFAFGWAAAVAVRRPAAFLHKKLGLPTGAARLLLILLSLFLLAGAAVLGVRGIVKELSALAQGLGGDATALLARVRDMLAKIPLIGERLAQKEFWGDAVGALLSALPTAVAALGGKLPSLLFTLGVGAIAAAYFCLDLERIHAALLRRIPRAWQGVLRFAKDSATRAALSVLRAQGVLVLIAFAFLLVGFLLLGVRYPLLLATLFCLFDILPVLGVGMLLVPWGFFALLSGARGLGIGLLLLFAVITLVRQFAEPRLLGASYGVHPLLTLLSLYAGGKLLGFVGLLLFPALTLLLYEMFFADEEKNKSHP